MSGVGVRPTREGRGLALPAGLGGVAGVVDGENEDWEDGGGAPGSVGGGPSPRDQWKQPVRAATTASITIATALNNGDSLDGVTLATGDRVLVKDQTAAEGNGIYVVAATPARATDMDADGEILGAVVYVIAGTANAGTAWAVTNTTAPVVDTDAITFAALSSGGGSATDAELNIEGGQSVIKTHGNMGATETFDPTDGNVHTGTLDANCTVTLNVPTGTGACLLELWLTEDATGGRTVTWPGSVLEQGTHTTTAGTTQRVLLDTVDGGTNWVATWVGAITFATPAIVLGSSAAAGSASTVIRSDSTIVAFDATVPVTQAFSDAAATGSAAVAARRDHVHGMPASPSGSGGASEHAHIVEETHLSDGSTVTWTLDNVYEPGSVIAWNTTTIARLTVTEVLPDKATVSAAGTTGDKIVFDYAATLA